MSVKKILAVLLVGLSLNAVADLTAEQKASLAAQGKARIQQFATDLKSTLQAGMQNGGPLQAIKLCHTASPALSEAASAEGWEVGRTSLKVRNVANAPDEWELAMLEDFVRKLREGVDFSELVAVQVEGDHFRMIKAIPTGAVCLSCHGDNLHPEVITQLDELYPADQARGFAEGDIRGAFSLRKDLRTTTF